MTLASPIRTRVVRAALAFLVALSALQDVAVAAGNPDVSFSKTAPSEALAGDPAIPITLTATNTTGAPSAVDGFNLTFVDVLRPGVSFVSSDPAPSQILTNTPHSGETTLVWRNVADLQAGVTQSLTYTIDAGTLPVGTTISNSRPGHDHLAGAYVNPDPFVVPSYNTTTNNVDNGDGWGTDGASTLLVPFILNKNQGDTEAELLRGLHDHQTVYTLEIENNHLGASTNFAIEDWIPAGMEFLGCGGVDNSSVFEPGSSGPINPGNEPGFANCVAPDVVETVQVDPPGPLPLGVYTHVVWNAGTLAASLPASGTVTYDWRVLKDFVEIPGLVGTEATFNFTPSEGGTYIIWARVGDDLHQDDERIAFFIDFTVLGDVEGNIFAADIVWLAEEGITKGCNPPVNDEYCPDDFVTRGQMAAFLVRFLGLTDNGGGNLFVDDNGSIFEGDIDRLATAGITKGCNPPTNNNFCPNSFVTRGQMAAFLHRAADLLP